VSFSRGLDQTNLDVTDAPHTDPHEATADRVPSDRP